MTDAHCYVLPEAHYCEMILQCLRFQASSRALRQTIVLGRRFIKLLSAKKGIGSSSDKGSGPQDKIGIPSYRFQRDEEGPITCN